MSHFKFLQPLLFLCINQITNEPTHRCVGVSSTIESSTWCKGISSSGNQPPTWASSVSSATYKYVFQAEIPSISVRIVLNHVLQVFVSIGDELKFKVFFNHDNLDIVWSDVSGFNHSSHGILGKYFTLVVR